MIDYGSSGYVIIRRWHRTWKSAAASQGWVLRWQAIYTHRGGYSKSTGAKVVLSILDQHGIPVDAERASLYEGHKVYTDFMARLARGEQLQVETMEVWMAVEPEECMQFAAMWG